MSFALSTSLMFIPLIQSVNKAHFLNITFVFLLFAAAAFPVFGMLIVPLTCPHASL